MSSSSIISTSSSMRRQRTGSYEDVESSSIKRQRIDTLMKTEEEELPVKKECLDLHFNLKENFKKVDALEEFVKNYKTDCVREKFDKTQPSIMPQKELQDQFYEFFVAIFENSEFVVHDMHKKALQYTMGCLRESSKLPDLTVTFGKPYCFGVYAVLFVEIKKSLVESQKLHFYVGFHQLWTHAYDLLITEGIFVPREAVWSVLTDGNLYYFFKFFVTTEGAFRFNQFLLGPDLAFDALIKFAHCFQHEPFTMNVTWDEVVVDLNAPNFLPYLQKVAHTRNSAIYFRRNCVLKINASPHSQIQIDNEQTIYKKLNSANDGVPFLTVAAEYTSKTKRFSAIVFKEQGSPISDVVGMHQVVWAIKKLHSTGHVHRDVRLPNLLNIEKKGERKMILIDFGFACEKNKELQYSGTMETASLNVLKQLQEGEVVTVKESDDLESLVKCLVLQFYNFQSLWQSLKELAFKENASISERAKMLETKWSIILKKPAVEFVFKELWIEAEGCKYNTLVEKMIVVEQNAF